jgi:hypothetical protein
VGARKPGVITCDGCGAEVSFGPASCPLCGGFVGNPPPPKGVRELPKKKVEDYHEDLRRLREELDKLRQESA